MEGRIRHRARPAQARAALLLLLFSSIGGRINPLERPIV